MKKLTSFFLLFSIIIPSNTAYSQNNIKTWTETTVQDFSDNQLNSLIVTNNSGGEVQLPHPLVKTVEDYNDNSIHRFVAKDSIGAFVKTWVQGGNVFVKKYSKDGNEITGTIKVNEIDGIAGQSGISRADIFNDGTYMVVWANLWEPGTSAENMFGQIFKNDSVKVGNNFKINETLAASAQHPSVFANKADESFVIFYSLPVSSRYRIHVQKRDKLGNKIGETSLLNADGITLNEMRPFVIGNDKNFYVGWEGFDNGVSTYVDIYFRKFNSNSSPVSSIIKVNDDSIDHAQFQPDLCLDEEGNIFIVWGDDRDVMEPIMSIQGNIYAQIFNYDAIKLGNNIRVNSFIPRKENREPDIEYINEELRISWLYWDEPNQRYLTRVNQWKFDPTFSGEIISSVFDASPSGSIFKKILWDAAGFSGTDLKFQLRTARTSGELNNSNWYGPLGVSDFYINKVGEDINSIHNEERYIQYKAVFTSEDGNSSILKSVSIQFSPFDTIPPMPPAALTAIPDHAGVILKWQPGIGQDLLEYKLYRRMQGSLYDNNWKVIIPKNILAYTDTSVEINKTYYYVLTAFDSSHNESDYSNEVMGTAFGINIYVSVTGSSGGDGSINQPFKTIQQGINASFSGDTVRVLSGTYNEAFVMKKGVSLIGINAEECGINVPINASDNCVIKGFTITKTLSCNGVSPVITENIFQGSSEIYMNAIDLMDSSAPFINKNIILECDRGISIYYKSNPLIKNNIISVKGIGIVMGWDDKPSIINNTIISKSGRPFELLPMITPDIQNNILVTTEQYAYVYQYDDCSANISYNDFWNSYQTGTQVPPTNLFLDPKFVNMDLQDYHLLSSSPCINAGNPDPAFNDIDGSRNDMGAYGGPDPIHTDILLPLSKSIYVSNLSGYPLDTVSVFIRIDNTAGLAKADFIIEIDNSILSYLGALLTDATHTYELQSTIISGSQTKFSLFSSIGVHSGSKEILEIRYLVNSNTQTGDASSLILKDVALFDINFREIFIRSISNGAFIVNNTNESERYIYVDCRGTNVGDGSRKNPFHTIMKGVDAANEGDTIFVYGGNYYGSVFIKDGITLVGSGASATNIIASGDSVALIFNNITKAEVSGFNIKGDLHDGGMPVLTCSSSSPIIKKNKFEARQFVEPWIEFSNNSNAVFENNYVNNAHIYINASAPILKYNVIEGVGFGAVSLRDCSGPLVCNNRLESRFGGPAVRIQNSNAVVRNNFIYCTENGIGFDLFHAGNSEIYNNIIIDKSAAGTGMIISNSLDNKIINNNVITRGKGIEEYNSSSTILNNIIINNNNFGLQLSSSSNYDYNDLWNNFVNYNGIDPGINDISLDPMFVDTSKGDYRLSAASPCRNAGNPNVLYNDTDGSRNDIGAYGGPYSDSSWIPQNNSSLAIDSIQAANIDTINISITGEGVEGMAEVNMSLSFDPSIINIISASSGNLTKSFSCEKTNLQPGTINLSLKSNKGIIEKNGELTDLILAVNSTQSLNTFLHFDSASVRDEITCLNKVLNLKDGKITIITGVDNSYNDAVPTRFSLSQNYPNPFNPSTKIRYEIPIENKVLIKVYDILGREVATLINDHQKAGRYEVEWNAGNFASGVYFYTIKAGDFLAVKKFILIK